MDNLFKWLEDEMKEAKQDVERSKESQDELGLGYDTGYLEALEEVHTRFLFVRSNQ